MDEDSGIMSRSGSGGSGFMDEMVASTTTTDTLSAAAKGGGSFMLVRQEEDDYDTQIKGFTGKENDSMMSIYFEQGIECNTLND